MRFGNIEENRNIWEEERNEEKFERKTLRAIRTQEEMLGM